MNYLKIEQLSNGNLRLSIDPKDMEEVKEDYDAKWADGRIMGYEYDLFEQYSTNGGYTLFDAGDANPFVGLTNAPCIAEAMDILDDGINQIIGKFWYYDNYQIKYWLEGLIETGEVIFTYGGKENPQLGARHD